MSFILGYITALLTIIALRSLKADTYINSTSEKLSNSVLLRRSQKSGEIIYPPSDDLDRIIRQATDE